jgi:hypothetical protein
MRSNSEKLCDGKVINDPPPRAISIMRMRVAISSTMLCVEKLVLMAPDTGGGCAAAAV